jgi:uncharacterized membrane protein (UPF0127 family)
MMAIVRRRLEAPEALPWLRRFATFVLVAGLVACTGEIGGQPEDPTLLPPGETQGSVTSSTATTTVERVPLEGFGEVSVQVTRVDGQIVSWCLLLADTPERRARGLMEVTDPELGGYDGMLFRFDGDSNASFWMRNTPQPLSIAYVAADGTLVSSTTMEPCGDSPDCPAYPAAGPYHWAVEVPVAAGGVEGLGIAPGAVFADLATGCAPPST